MLDPTTLMTPMSAPADLLWSWRRVTDPARVFTLRSAEALLGGLRYERGWRASLSSLATADCAEARYSLKRTGWTRSVVTVRVPGVRRNVATLKRSWRGEGTLETAEGKRYLWKKLALMKTEFGFFTEGDAAILRIRSESLTGDDADVAVIDGARSLPEFHLLALVAFYLFVAYRDDARRQAAS